jgi:hypothetical protein
MDLQTRIATWFGERVVRRPGTILVAALALVGVSSALATRLYINTNQLDLISQDLRQVKDVKRVIDMVGGVGHLIIALRGNDEAVLKGVADDLDVMLEADDVHVRTSSHKLDASFLRDRAGLLMRTPDLEELKRRVDEKLADVARRANPFFFEIVPTEPKELVVKDLVDKYRSVGKRRIDDDYNISNDRKMLLIVVKPMWNNTELDRTGDFLEALRERFAKYGASNGHGARLVEDYSGTPDPDGKVVQFGFTGSYPLSFDDAHQIKQSLVPVSSIAFVGVLVVLLIFFGRFFTPVLLIMLGLSAGISITYGFAAATIGELNMITAILAGILTGNGEDFGVFVAYRLREEFRLDVSIDDAIKRTIVHAGPASFVSAAGSGVAFLSLLFSEFRGFSQFGLLAGMGIFIIGLTIYAVLPSSILVIDRWFPGAARKMIGPPLQSAEEEEALSHKSIPYPRTVLALSVLLALGLSFFAKDVTFDYNSRALMVENQPTLRLQDELNERMQISADPVGIWTPTTDEAKKVYDYFKSRADTFKTVDQAVSPFTFIPPPEQQEANAKILRQWKEELSKVDVGLLPEEFKGRWDEAMKLLSAEPYTVATVPPAQADLFRALPSAKPENQGWLTFVYPTVDLWEGKQLMNFSDEIEDVPVEGATYHAAGMPVLMATLARIVLRDARMFVVVTMILLFLILLADLRSLKSALVALLPLAMGGGIMMGVMGLFGIHLNFMNIVVFPIVLAYGVSQGVYLIHRFNEGTAPRQALKAVGTAVVCSTLTTLAGWAALVAAPHKGLKTMGLLACIGMTSVLLVTFTVMPAILQILHDRRLAARKRDGGSEAPPPAPSAPAGDASEARVA